MTKPPLILHSPPITARRVFQEPGFWLTGLPALVAVFHCAGGGCPMFLEPFAVVFSVIMAVTGAIWEMVSHPPAAFKRTAIVAYRLRRACAIAFWLMLIASVPLTRWPMHVAFAVSRPSLDTLADRAERGEKIRYPVRCGLLVIKNVQMERINSLAPRAAPRLWLQGNDTNLVGSLTRGPFEESSYGEFSLTNLGNGSTGWFHVCED